VLRDDTADAGRFCQLYSRSGGYGRRRLQQLAGVHDHPRAALISATAVRILQGGPPHQLPPQPPPRDPAQRLSAMKLYPAGRTLDPALKDALLADWHRMATGDSTTTLAGLYADLDGDGVDEFVLLGADRGWVYQERAGRWQLVGHVFEAPADSWSTLQPDLDQGRVTLEPSRWRELVIGVQRLHVEPGG
jgi:hypothetical protein